MRSTAPSRPVLAAFAGTLGPIEFRIVVDGSRLSGEWAAPFGRNGTLRGVRVD
jgi:hypothetical protein